MDVQFALVCILLSMIYIVVADNPTAIVQPFNGSDPGYIIAESPGGLSNRLRVMAAYMYIGENKYNGAHLGFVWEKNSACPGHFHEIFEPIDNLFFLTNTSRCIMSASAKASFESSMFVMSLILSENGIPRKRRGQLSWGQIELKMYAQFVPKRQIMEKVLKFVKIHNICNISAMHLRTTDLGRQLAQSKKPVNIGAFHWHVETRPPGEPVYLMTDNPETQQRFLNEYGPKKILVYQWMPGVHYVNMTELASSQLVNSTIISYNNSIINNTIINSNTNSNSNSNSNSNMNNSAITVPTTTNYTALFEALPSDHRFTSLEHTLIDVLIAAHAKELKPAMYSSLSDLISIFSRIGRRDRGWCGGTGSGA